MDKRSTLPACAKNLRIAAVVLVGLTWRHTLQGQACPINDAIKSGEIEKVRSIIQVDPKSVACRSADGQTPIFQALVSDRQESVPDLLLLLLSSGANVNDKDSHGDTPLFRAVLSGSQTAGILLAHGADPNVRDNYDKTPLDQAMYYNDSRLFELLVNHGSDVNARNSDGDAPLHFLGADNHLDEIKLLIAHGAEVNARNKKGETPLLKAVKDGYRWTAGMKGMSRFNRRWSFSLPAKQIPISATTMVLRRSPL